MIYAIGNSHAHLFTNSPPGDTVGNRNSGLFRSYSLGPVIAYNFCENHLPNLLTLLNRLTPNKDLDFLMLVVGEVDCRWHLPKQAEQKKIPVEIVVNECVDRYFRAFVTLKSMGYKTICFAAHPSTISGHDENLSSPVYGNCLLRNNITRQYNKRLERLCRDNGIIFISIEKYLLMPDGSTNMAFFKDYCHLSQKAMPLIEEELRKASVVRSTK